MTVADLPPDPKRDEPRYLREESTGTAYCAMHLPLQLSLKEQTHILQQYKVFSRN